MILKIFKVVLYLSMFITILSANNLNKILKTNGITVNYIDDDDNKKNINIKRIHNEICKKVDGTNPDTIWSDDYASISVNKSCKKTFVTTVGRISPISIADGITTYGELEVIDFIKKAQTDKNMLLVDARLTDWYFAKTIPTSINIPFTHFNSKKQPDEFEDVLDTTGVTLKNGKYNFSNAKTLLLFCNGIWCPQSTWAIKNLLKVGYPKNKLFWYRGGLYSWTSLNLTTITP